MGVAQCLKLPAFYRRGVLNWKIGHDLPLGEHDQFIMIVAGGQGRRLQGTDFLRDGEDILWPGGRYAIHMPGDNVEALLVLTLQRRTYTAPGGGTDTISMLTSVDHAHTEFAAPFTEAVCFVLM